MTFNRAFGNVNNDRMVARILVLWLGLSASLPFGGTTILIMVGVGLQTVKEINSQLQQRHYEGFLS